MWSLRSVEASDDALKPYLACLDDAEHERAARFSASDLRRDFVVARAGLRVLLGDALGRPAADLRFTYGARGKPELGLEDDGPEAAISFNLSHSNGLAALVICRQAGFAVGIDIERQRTVKPELARRYFAADEWVALSKMPEGQREASFFNLWVAKEACLKASGLGVSGGLDAFSFDVGSLSANADRALPCAVSPRHVHGAWGVPEQWRLALFDPGTCEATGAGPGVTDPALPMSGAVAVFSGGEIPDVQTRFRLVSFSV
ncbi:MAG: 4'-phosphopantetheinyl transferase superfamily protein [Pseudomonadota bacterium]